MRYIQLKGEKYMDRYTKVEYICTYCGERITKVAWAGQPNPGTCKRRKDAINGRNWPHSWVINRTFEKK